MMILKRLHNSDKEITEIKISCGLEQKFRGYCEIEIFIRGIVMTGHHAAH